MAGLAEPFVSATWEDIARAATLPGISVASHTRTHANLAVLDDVELISEIAGARRELKTRIPSSRPWLAYPFGRSSAPAERVAEQIGCEFAFRVDGGVVLGNDDPPPRYRLPRLNVPAGLTLAGFRLRANGLLGR